MPKPDPKIDPIPEQEPTVTEPTTVTGSVEILTNDNQSIGEDGLRWTRDTVPIVLNAKHAITDLTPVDPPTYEVPADGPELVAQWAGVDDRSQPVTVLLWRETPFEQTAIGKALAAASE